MEKMANKIGKIVFVIFLLTFYSCNNSSNQEQNHESQKIFNENQKALMRKNLIANSITEVLKEDKEISNYTNHDPKKQADEMRNIDLSACPSDFSVAYVDHIHAWEDYARTVKVWNQWISDENINNLILEAYFNEILGTDVNTYDNAVEVENKIKNQLLLDENKIRETFQEVERIAIKYGAKLQSY